MNLRRLAMLTSLLLVSSGLFAAPPRKAVSILQWGDSPEAYFLTTQERIEWSQISGEQQAQAFINNYWARHGEAFHHEVLTRVAAADKYFPLGERRGSETERGRVFIVLGAPDRQKSDRNDNVASAMSERGNMNSIEQRAFGRATWVYKPDRLPKDLGVAELSVTFQIDVNRGYDTIENPGLIEPYLKRAEDFMVARFKPPAGTPVPPTPTEIKAAVAASLVPPDDAVWAAENALNGAILTGDSYVSPTDKPFYAVDFYLPKGNFDNVGDVVVAGVIRDGDGRQVASVRTPAKAAQYDAHGDRFVDAGFELPAGHYSGAFALATTDGKILATSRQSFDVMPAEHVGITKVLMTSRIDTLDKQSAFDPFTFVATKYNVKGDRRFRTADKIGYFVTVTNPTASPDPSMTMKMRVSRDGKVVDNGAWMPVELSQTGPHTYLLATQFEANSLTPGHYSIELQLRDMKADKSSDAYAKGFAGKTEFDVVQ
jgi:GWxTD domain-containing protein